MPYIFMAQLQVRNFGLMQYTLLSIKMHFVILIENTTDTKSATINRLIRVKNPRSARPDFAR